MLEAAAIGLTIRRIPSADVRRNTLFDLNNSLGEDANDLRDDNREDNRAEKVGAEQVVRICAVEIMDVAFEVKTLKK